MITYIRLFFIVLHSFLCSVLALISLLIDRSFTTYFLLSRLYPWGVLKISGIKLEVTGKENVDPNQVYVYVANHSSLYDISAMQAAFPNNAVMVFKKELSKIPVFGWQLYLGPYIFIDRDNAEKAMKSIQRAKEQMEKRKISVLLFAEGTRSKTGEVQPFKRGAFYLASKVGFPVVPTSISGTSKILPKGKLKIVPGTIKIHFEKPIPTENVKTRAEEIALMETVRNIIIEHKEN